MPYKSWIIYGAEGLRPPTRLMDEIEAFHKDLSRVILQSLWKEINSGKELVHVQWQRMNLAQKVTSYVSFSLKIITRSWKGNTDS